MQLDCTRPNEAAQFIAFLIRCEAAVPRQLWSKVTNPNHLIQTLGDPGPRMSFLGNIKDQTLTHKPWWLNLKQAGAFGDTSNLQPLAITEVPAEDNATLAVYFQPREDVTIEAAEAIIAEYENDMELIAQHVETIGALSADGPTVKVWLHGEMPVYKALRDLLQHIMAHNYMGREILLSLASGATPYQAPTAAAA